MNVLRQQQHENLLQKQHLQRKQRDRNPKNHHQQQQQPSSSSSSAALFCKTHVQNNNNTFSSDDEAQSLEPGISPLPSWVFPYVEHQRQLVKSNPFWKQQRLGLCPHNNKKTDNPLVLPTVRWICPPDQTLACGGVGDRLYGMVMTWYMALTTNRTFVAVLQPVPGQLQHQTTDWLTPYLQPALVSTWRLVQPPSFSVNNEHLVRIHDHRKHKALLEPCQTPPLQRIQNRDATPTVYVQNNLFTNDTILRQSDCWQDFLGDKDEVDQRPLFHVGFWTLFRWTDRVYKAARALQLQAFVTPPSHYMAVHMRTGQGETWEDPLRHTGDAALAKFYTCTLKMHEALTQRCASLSSTTTSTWMPIYVAADNNYAKQRLLAMDQDQQNPPPKNSKNHRPRFVAVSDLEILHLVKSRRKEFDNADQAQDSVWGELFILTHATCLVMSYSKFSYMASDLSTQQPRCAVLFDECDADHIQQAVSHVTTCPQR